ncbi:MAG TPA: hypothetical protein VFK13_05170 [Gemmatimonadaceae bacterium]|nr:hypothetical protein [Gemmatimonadaceae bacterium]
MPDWARVTEPTGALAGVAPGVQAQGVWAGRRQLFIRFAGEAETAVLYTASKLGREIDRTVRQLPLHSIALSGLDPLGNADLLIAAFGGNAPALPVMADCRGERPEDVPRMAPLLSLVQVTLDLSEPAGHTERALATVAEAARVGCAHAVVLAPRNGMTDAQLLRLIEQVHAASAGTKIVVHPPTEGESAGIERYGTLLEEGMAIHRDVRIAFRIPPPLGTR